MNNKIMLGTCLLALAGLGCAPGIYAADEPGWYIGAGVGRADVKKTSSFAQITDAAMFAGGFVTNTVIKSNDVAAKVFGGYQFNENFAVEGAYHNFGRFDGATVVAATGATVPGTWEAYAFSVAAVGIYPFAKRFAVLGKLGLAGSWLDVKVPAPVVFNRTENRYQPLLGVGLRFDITQSFGARVEFERFNNVGDSGTTGQSPINVWSLSAQFRF